MTVTFPDGIEARGTGAVFLAPAVADPLAPKLTEYNAATAVNISCDLMGFETTAEQSKVATTRYCLKQESEALGTVKYGISDITVVYDPQAPTSAEYKAYKALMGANKNWYLFDRRGVDSTTALAVGQIGDVYQITIGAVRREPITTTEGELLRSTFTVAVSGQAHFDVAMVA